MSGALPGGELLAIRYGGQRGRLLAVDLRRGKQAFSLPPGLLAADGRHYIAVRVRTTETTLGSYDPQSGASRGVWSVRNQWMPGAVAPTGRRVMLLRRPSTPGGYTRFALVSTARRDIVRQFRLRGLYDVESLSPDARRIYLVRWRNGDYDLQLYDLATHALRPNPPVSEDGAREKMKGTAWIGLPSSDGRMLYTLYVKNDSSAFVHALDLTGGQPHCIDLPGRARYPFETGMAALVLSPDSRTLYVTQPRVGQVAVVDVKRMKVVRTVRFQRAPVSSMTSPGAISPNGRTLYFGGEGQLWAYDTAYGRVRGPYDAPSGVLGIAFSPDGRRLVVVDAGRQVTLRDAATGGPITR